KLVELDYEVYFLDDYRDIEYVCQTYSDPHIFINIDEGLGPYGWLSLVSRIMDDEELNHAKLGILSYREDEVMARAFRQDLKVPCDFIVLNDYRFQGGAPILRLLDVNGGKRRKVRAVSENRKATLNLNFGGELHFGEIGEISSVGMTVIMDKDIHIRKYSAFSDIQLKLRGSLALVSAVVMGHRLDEKGRKVYVFLFRPKPGDKALSLIRRFVQERNQAECRENLLFMRKFDEDLAISLHGEYKPDFFGEQKREDYALLGA
ncbi:MAG: hypothetical protein PQJ60_00175, partial [Spirochaetales bacterium]|nr:hypothetical protein [Spirochaetales bacterium]